ncbi:MAG TPA: arylsulfatase [Chthoniobacteraceae bacterium]|jgi:arylsulfatase A-like enzyme|nr:arylsulfatase [Chthoniobacteraceae bacterium]
MKFIVLSIFAALFALTATAADRPNIVLIYADDLGYGDVSCYGATKVLTPNIDRLAREGLRFTDAHSSSATCTPSRFAMLTGEYAFRQKGTGVLPGNANLIIKPGRTTLPSVLKGAGYATGVVGKWHLGLGQGEIDWNAEIKPGPREIGFDYSFLMPATGDRVPCVYVENQRIVGVDPNDPIRVSFGQPLLDEPTGKDHPELLRLHPSHGHDQTIVNGISRIGYVSGGKAARWVDEDMADVLTRKAASFIEDHKVQRFFLYFATHDIHVPRVPHSRFAGMSGLGPRGDVILQLDWSVGEILNALDRLGLAENTLVIFSSDNGPVVDDGYKDDAVEKLDGHRPAGPLRGGKYSAFEGGTRVPFIVRWPKRVQRGVSDALISQVDLLATFTALTGQSLGTGDAPDSFNVLRALLGESKIGRDHLIEHAGVLSLRQGPWKYIEPGKGPRRFVQTNTESGQAADGQLFNLDDDLGETKDRTAEHPEKLKEFAELVKQLRAQGRSR